MIDWKVPALLLTATALAVTATLIPEVGVGVAKAETAVNGQPASAADSLPGSLGTSITSKSPQARHAFDRGLRLAFSFDHANALRAFRRAQKLDPGCALCFWGEAWALGPNVNAPMQPEAGQPASDALRKARRLARDASEKEKALIDALETRYFDASDADPSDQEDPGREILDLEFAHAMGAVHRRFPGDDDIAVLFAEAMMNLSPRDYWEADAQTPKGRTFEIIALLESVLARNPHHTAAIRLYTHITGTSGTPEAGEIYADRLSVLTPECSSRQPG